MNDFETIDLETFRKEQESDYYKGLMDGFELSCKKCGSTDVKFLEKSKNPVVHHGCDTCSYGSSAEFNEAVAVKCKSCGNARKIERKREVE